MRVFCLARRQGRQENSHPWAFSWPMLRRFKQCMGKQAFMLRELHLVLANFQGPVLVRFFAPYEQPFRRTRSSRTQLSVGSVTANRRRRSSRPAPSPATQRALCHDGIDPRRRAAAGRREPARRGPRTPRRSSAAH